MLNESGINRASWDLNEDGPVKWRGTYKINQGPDEGPEAIPGTYVVRLNVDGHAYDQTITVEGDPRAAQSMQAYRERHDYLARIYDEVGTIDAWLNATGALSDQPTRLGRTALSRFQRQLTYNPRNDEDLSAPLGLRERLLDLLSRASSSYAPPNAAQLAEENELHAMYEKLSVESAQFVKR